MAEEYISFNDARKILGLDEDTMLDLIVDNKIRNRKIDGENRVLAEDVEAYRQSLLKGPDVADAVAASHASKDGLELETLELIDETAAGSSTATAAAGTATSVPADATVVLEETKVPASATEVIPDKTGGSTTAAPLRTEELFFEDDDLHDETSRTQDVTVIEQAVSNSETHTAPIAEAVAVTDSVTEEFSPEETPRDVAARKRGGKAPSPIRRSAAAGSRRGGVPRPQGPAKPGAPKDIGWTVLVAAVALLAAWPLVMIVTQAWNGGYTNSDAISQDVRIPDYTPSRQMVEIGSDLMPMWKADWFKSVKEVFTGSGDVLSVSGNRITANPGTEEVLGRPALKVDAVEDDFRPQPNAVRPGAPENGEAAPAEDAAPAEGAAE